ncbi:MAG: hypothetical protein LGB71_07435, partial [Sulfurovum sp.]|nr:hypothetical protein [Sulfurovum sp.]
SKVKLMEEAVPCYQDNVIERLPLPSCLRNLSGTLNPPNSAITEWLRQGRLRHLIPLSLRNCVY